MTLRGFSAVVRLKLVAVLVLGAFALASPVLPLTPRAAADEIAQCPSSGAHPMIQRGVYNSTAVKHAQCLLKEFWLYDIAVDGDFGPETERAVRDFQSFMGLDVDGIIGPCTWDALHPYDDLNPKCL